MSNSLLKKVMVLFCFITSMQCSFSENTETEDPRKEKNNKEFYFYLDNAKRTQRINPDSSHYYAKKAIEIAFVNNDELLKAVILNIDAITYARCNNIAKGLKIFKEVYRIYDKESKKIKLSGNQKLN